MAPISPCESSICSSECSNRSMAYSVSSTSMAVVSVEPVVALGHLQQDRSRLPALASSDTFECRSKGLVVFAWPTWKRAHLCRHALRAKPIRPPRSACRNSRRLHAGRCNRRQARRHRHSTAQSRRSRCLRPWQRSYRRLRGGVRRPSGKILIAAPEDSRSDKVFKICPGYQLIQHRRAPIS